MSTIPQGDPWDWSVDDVVDAFCKSRELWAGNINSALPDAFTLETILREQQINGSTLLEHVNFETLKEDLNIRPLGQRGSIMHAVRLLQSQSIQYSTRRSQLLRHVGIHDYSPHQTLTPSSLSVNLERVPSRFETPATHVDVINSPEAQSIRHSVDRASPEMPVARSGEVLVTDERSQRKRRKLNLSAPIIATASNRETLKTSQQGYFGRAKIPLDSLFFNSTGEDSSDTASEDNFDFIQSPAALGRQIFTARRMRHFLLQQDQEVDNNSRVIYPYPKHLIQKGQCQNTILFKEANGKIKVQKRDAIMLRSDIDMQDDDANNNDFDFLSKWINRTDDEEIAVWRDSDEESEIDEVTAAEIKKDQEESRIEQSRQVSLTDHEVIEAINESIDSMVEKWNAKLPTRQWRAWGIWKTSRGRQLKMINAANQRVEELNIRLQNLQQNLVNEVWTNRVQVTKQCFCLEQTIFDKLHHLWKISIINSREPPQRSVNKPKRYHIKTFDIDEEGGELLESGSENSDHFIDDEGETQSDISMEDSRPDEFVELKSDPTIDRTNIEQEMISPIVQDAKNLRQTSADVNPGSPHNSKLALDTVIATGGKGTVQELIPEIIDLTMSSPERELEETVFSSAPEFDTVQDIEKFSTVHLEERNDRKRLILKIFHEQISQELKEGIKHSLQSKTTTRIADEIMLGLGAVKRKENFLPGYKVDAYQIVDALARLFLCWFLCRDVFKKPFGVKQIQSVIEATKGQAKEHIEPIVDFFNAVMEAHEDLDDDLGPPLSSTPTKRRKGVVKQSEQVRNIQKSTRQRREEGKEREKILILQVGAQALSDHNNGVIININKREDEDLIYINPRIGSKIKSHQIEGVRFMWRELVAGGSENLLGEGCLLAHTMGLGKTMQTITVLVTIAEAAKSKNPNISKQIPSHLAAMRILILCPAGLIENWTEELRIWIPPDTASLGSVSYINASQKPKSRLQVVSYWHEHGGVLVMGYEMFRQLIKKEHDPTAAKESVMVQLLDGPSLVVADEAHVLKNTTSKLSIATARFRTHSRIALTGSPLANKLLDYYAMINWIAPNFLGDATEFKAHYEEPIQAGSYIESSSLERRQALKKLRVLESVLEPKINRAGIAVLKEDLKPKIEFVITIPLTNVQDKAYREFVGSLATGNDVGNTRIWAWIHILALLCNHPIVFLAKLEEKRKAELSKESPESTSDIPSPTQAENEYGEDDSNATLPGEMDISKIWLPDTMLEHQIEHLKGYDDPRALEFSNKMTIIVKILDEARKVGDKTLLFSHSIPTLNYLETLLASNAFSYKRLDGLSKMPDRLRMVKEFNDGHYHVFLISTRAGGHGINLPGANRVIIVDFNFNPTWEEQAVGRAYRIGQKKPVFVYHFVTGGTFEEKVHNKALFKTQLAFRVVDKKQPERSASKARDFLFEPRPVPQREIEEFRGKDQVMDAVLADPNCLVRGLSTTETLHRESNEELTAEELIEVTRMQEEETLRMTNRPEYEKQLATKQWDAFRKPRGSQTGEHVLPPRG